MKVNQDIRVNVDNLQHDKKQKQTGNVRFQDIVQKTDHKLQAEQLEKLLSNIESAGKRLAHSRTFKDLAKFKTLVKQFVRETVDFGMGLKQSFSWNEFGHGRSLKVVETIDEKLVELTEEVLENEGDSINILNKVGEIKGLLINLYT